MGSKEWGSRRCDTLVSIRKRRVEKRQRATAGTGVGMTSLMAAANEAKLLQLARTHYAAQLTDGEERVLRNSVRPMADDGKKGEIGKYRIRGEFLRWLVNDRRVAELLDKDGLTIDSAKIEGTVDMRGATVPFDVSLSYCSVMDMVMAESAEIRSVTIRNSVLFGGMTLEHATLTGSLLMPEGFISKGSIDLSGVHVGGDLQMSGAVIADKALYLSGAEIHGAAFLDGITSGGKLVAVDTKFGGEVGLSGSKFAGTLMMSNSTFAGNLLMDGVTVTGMLNLQGVNVAGIVVLSSAKLQAAGSSMTMRSGVVAGNVFLTSSEPGAKDYFEAKGKVDFSQATVKGQLVVSSASMTELDCSMARLGTLTWVDVQNASKTKLTLVGASMTSLTDEKKSWPAKGGLTVRGFSYDRIPLVVPQSFKYGETALKMDSGAANPDDRIAWLKLQTDSEITNSQPWLQLAAFVKARGNPSGAKRVTFEMERVQARNEGIATRGLTYVYDVIEENPLRLFLPVLLLWAFGWLIFWRARRMAAMAPTEKDAYAHFEEKGKEPAHYPPFSAAVYTLENVLPVVKLGQDALWHPNPTLRPEMRTHPKRWMPRMTYGWLSALRWVLIVVGWVLALILAAAIGDTFKG